MSSFMKKCSKALNDGKVDKDCDCYKSSFSPTLSIVSSAIVFLLYGTITSFAPGLYYYLTNSINK